MFDILAQLGELAPDMIRRKPNGPPKQMLLPSQIAIGELMQGAQEAMGLDDLRRQQRRPEMDYRVGVDDVDAWGNGGIGGDFSRGGHDGGGSSFMEGGGGITMTEEALGRPRGMQGALAGMAAQMAQAPQSEEIKHASFDLPGASNNGIRQQTISGLRGYARGGTLRAGDMGIVGEEDPEVIRARKGGGVDVIPIDSEADTQGYFQANPTDAPIPDGVQQTVAAAQQGQPDARQLINPQDQAIADEYGKLDVERQKTTKSPWKDAGFGILQGLNNALNRRNDPIQGWNEFGEEKRMRPIKQRIGELETQRKIGLDVREKQADIDIKEQRPGLEESKRDLAEFKAINDAEHKRNTVALGKEKADEIKANNLRIYEWRKRGVDQNDTRIKILEQRNEEIKRHNQVTEKQGDAKIGQTGAKIGNQRDQFLKNYELRVQQAKAGKAFKSIDEVKKIEQAVVDGKMDRATADAMLRVVQAAQ